MRLTDSSLVKDHAAWVDAGVALPSYDREAAREAAATEPAWVHFGCGNIFKQFIAVLADDLLAAGGLRSGLIGVDRGGQAIERVWQPHDGLALAVTLNTDGTTPCRVVGSVVENICVATEADFARLTQVFRSPGLQMASYTITEKGYVVRDSSGELVPAVARSVESGEVDPSNLIVVTAALLRERWAAGGAPLTLVSMDNRAHNGDALRDGVLAVVRGWVDRGHADPAFVAWVENRSRVSFPCTMIDKIVPGPSDEIAARLAAMGIEDMEPQTMGSGTRLAPFANGEAAQYLVIEDAFVNGRPELFGRGVHFADRAAVEAAEHMKVSCGLNPLHTALAVYGCLLGSTYMADTVADDDMAAMVRGLGYDESLPVVGDAGIIDPKDFLDEFLGTRVCNPFLKDSPKRIAMDTSQKVGVRFGATIRGHMAAGDVAELRYVPLAIAGWLCYLQGVDDAGEELACSPDPRLDELQALLAAGRVRDILSDESIFSLDLYEAGVAPRVEEYLARMSDGPGSVRATLHDVVSA